MTTSAFDIIASSKCEFEDVGKVSNSANKSPTQHYFQNIWQKQPAIFHCGEKPSISLNWDEIADLLHHCRNDESTEPPPSQTHILYTQTIHMLHISTDVLLSSIMPISIMKRLQSYVQIYNKLSLMFMQMHT